MSFLRGVAQTLDLQPAAQTFVDTRRRAEDRKYKLEDEMRRLQERAASLGINIEGMDRDAALGAIGEYQSHDATTARAVETEMATGGFSSVEALQQYKQRQRELELQKTEVSIPGTKNWWEAKNQEAIVKDRDAFRSIAQTAFGLGFDIRTKDGVVNQEEMDKYLAFAKRTSDAVTKSKEALAQYYEKDRTPAGVLKLERDQRRIETHLPQWMAEMRYYEDSPDKDRLEAYIKDYTIPGGQSDAKFKLIQDLFIEVRQRQAERRAAFVADQRQASADNPGWGVYAPTNQAPAPGLIETWTPSFTSSPAPVEAAPAPGETPPPAAAGASVDTSRAASVNALQTAPVTAPGEASPAFGNMTDPELKEWYENNVKSGNQAALEAAVEEMRKRPRFNDLWNR